MPNEIVPRKLVRCGCASLAHTSSSQRRAKGLFCSTDIAILLRPFATRRLFQDMQVAAMIVISHSGGDLKCPPLNTSAQFMSTESP